MSSKGATFGGCPFRVHHRNNGFVINVRGDLYRHVPHHLTREGPDRGVSVRVGSTNRRADPEVIEELRRYARGEAYDGQPMPELDSEAVDFRAASESSST